MKLFSTSIPGYCRGFVLYTDPNRNPVFGMQVGRNHFLIILTRHRQWVWHRKEEKVMSETTTQYFLLEASNAWGASTYIDSDGNWTFSRAAAKRYATLVEAQEAKHSLERGKLARIEVYRDE